MSAVTDALGTTVLSRQDFTPWGAVRAGGVGQTALNFTGQRQDASGLLYYNARYYDPALARFLSADTAPPGKENPQARNRYSYALDNPLMYTDPSGHCGVRQRPGASDKAIEKEDELCAQYISWLKGWGAIVWDYDGWLASELALVWNATQDLANFYGWDVRTFRRAMMGNDWVHLHRKPAWDDCGGPACTQGSEITIANSAFYYADGSARGSTDSMFYVVHELGHAWDFTKAGKSLSAGLVTRTGGRQLCQEGGCFWAAGDAEHAPSGYAQSASVEDWAETVAFSVYPQLLAPEHQPDPAHNRGFGPGTKRYEYARCVALAYQLARIPFAVAECGGG